MVTLFATCAATLWINMTPFPWNKHDEKIYQRATFVCSTDYRYKKEFPCVKTFTKTEERTYQVICGRPL